MRDRFLGLLRALMFEFLLPKLTPPPRILIAPLLFRRLRLKAGNRNPAPLRIHRHKR
jgi:hypothetical protein